MRISARPILLAIALLGGASAFAVDAPHGSGNSIACGECHVAHSTLGEILVNSADSLVATLCISCHSPGGWVGMTKELSSSQQAVPGTVGTSHRWDVSTVNPTYGAELPQTAALFQHLSADSSITCATCHDPHEQRRCRRSCVWTTRPTRSAWIATVAET